MCVCIYIYIKHIYIYTYIHTHNHLVSLLISQHHVCVSALYNINLEAPSDWVH